MPAVSLEPSLKYKLSYPKHPLPPPLISAYRPLSLKPPSHLVLQFWYVTSFISCHLHAFSPFCEKWCAFPAHALLAPSAAVYVRCWARAPHMGRGTPAAQKQPPAPLPASRCSSRRPADWGGAARERPSLFLSYRTTNKYTESIAEMFENCSILLSSK